MQCSSPSCKAGKQEKGDIIQPHRVATALQSLSAEVIWTCCSYHSRCPRASAAQATRATNFGFPAGHHRRRDQRPPCGQERVREALSWGGRSVAAFAAAEAVGDAVGVEAFRAAAGNIAVVASGQREGVRWTPSIHVGEGTGRDEGVSAFVRRDRIYCRAGQKMSMWDKSIR